MAHSAYQSRLQNFFRLLSEIRHSDVFDQGYYRGQSLGAKLSIDPVLHYLFVGWKQGLNPSPAFDTRFYIERYRDVRESKANPLKHYMIHGREEGRLATRSGRIFRESLLPEYAPLPIFGAPAGDTPRLCLVIDDHTPNLLGVGYLPLLGLAIHAAARASWSLRIIIRSRTITTATISQALNAVSPSERPVVDITRREPGPTDDVDATETDIWWASSASSLESLRHLLPANNLWWVMTADEASRVPAGEHRELVHSLIADKSVRIISVGNAVSSSLQKSRVSVGVAELPVLIEPVATTRKGKTLGVLVDPDHPESLATTASSVVEYALTHHLLDPAQWSVTLIGLDWEALTISGSVVVDQTRPNTPDEWALALGGIDSLLVVQAGTEQPWLSDHSPVPAVTGRGDVAELADALGQSLTAKASPAPVVSWSDVVKPIVAAVEKARG